MTPQEKAIWFREIFIDIKTAIMFVDSELNGDNLMSESVEEWKKNYWYWVEVKNELNKL